MLNVERVRRDFPILNVEAHAGVPLIYLDSAASSQKPTVVIEAMNRYYREYNANVHRGIHRLSEDATNAYEGARARIGRFINAPTAETIFTRNATESLNLVAYSWGRANLHAGDEILTTALEHHANIVPWQIIAEMTGATVRYLPFAHADGTLVLDELPNYLTERTKLFAFTAVSNVFGTIMPVRELVAAAHSVGAIAVVDGAQAVPHMPVDVKAWDCDFMAFSSHKMCGPTGIGVLYGKRELLAAMPPFMGGGDMIRRVTLDGSTWNELPYKFEAGTPSIAEGIGLGAAVDYLTELGMENVHAHETFITTYALDALREVAGLTMIGPPAHQRAGVAAFTLAGVHPHDIAQLLDRDGIAIRAGHHCAMPLHQQMGITATARASFYVHTTTAEIDALVVSLTNARKTFGY